VSEPFAGPADGDAVAAIRLDHVVAGYYADQPVLQDLCLDCAPGRVTALLGPNGAGKSTALKVMAGLLRASAGRVLLFGRDVTRLTAHELARAGVAFLPQGRSLFPELTVEDNLELGGWVLDRGRRRLAVQAMYDRYPDLRASRRVPAGRLSGGQQRLLEISRALVADPKVVVVDEPSVGLSPILAERSYQELRRLKQEGRTVVLVDQNVRPAVALADYICSLRGGRVERAGTPGELATDLSGLVREWLGVEQAGTAPPGPPGDAGPAMPAGAPDGRPAR
jgi:branched-chain amino acid transport system ATP-binding protein